MTDDNENQVGNNGGENAPARRGPSYQVAEDVELCRAFIAASEDAVVGTNQRSADFKNKFHLNYVALIREHNSMFQTRYTDRTGGSAFNRFKKISMFVHKYHGILESSGEPPSGDTGKEEYYKMAKETFLQRYPEARNLADNVITCYDVLHAHPKWQSFSEEEDEAANGNKRKERPIGSKKAKERKADEDLVKSVMSVAKSNDPARDHEAKKEAFMDRVGSSMDIVANAIQSTMEEANTLKLMGMLSPNSKKRLAKEMFKTKMKKMKAARNNFSSRISVSSPITIDLVAGPTDNGNDESVSSSDEDEDLNEALDQCSREEDRRVIQNRLVYRNADGSVMDSEDAANLMRAVLK
jgi:hypothetical protein